MTGLVRLIDRFTEGCGRVLAWSSFAMMALTCAVVLLRYVLQGGNQVFLQESVIYLHASAFMLGSAWTLKRNGHVRVDIFYRTASARTRAWIDSLGVLLFLIPMSMFLFWVSLDYVGRSWTIREVSPEPGGIPATYLLKSLIPAMAALMIAQGLAELLRSALVLMQDRES